MIKRFFSVFFIFITVQSWAQYSVKGRVVNTQKQPVYGVNILLKQADQIVTYSQSTAQGVYRVNVNETGNYQLVFTALGYKSDTVTVQLTKSQPESVVNRQLVMQTTALETVFLESKSPIEVCRDTITFQTGFFTDGSEETVEDMLDKLPGVSVGEDGKITVANRPIDKLLIEDDDLFGSGYKILSKNMPAYPIEEVEILEHYSDNTLLKGVEKSDKIAINLKLGKAYKRVWFGNLVGGIGNENYHELKANLMNFGRKTKYYFLGGLNTTGNDMTGDIAQLIYDKAIDFGGQVKNKSLISIEEWSGGLDESRTNFNRAKLVSLNAILHPTKKLEVKPLLFFNRDDQDYYRQYFEQVNANAVQFENRKDYRVNTKKRALFGRLILQYDFAQNQQLKSVTKFTQGDFSRHSRLDFNDLPSIENLKNDQHYFTQALSYTQRVDTAKVIQIKGRFVRSSQPVTYGANQFLLGDLFSQSTPVDSLSQNIAQTLTYWGLEGQFLNRHNNGHLLDLKLGVTNRIDDLDTYLSLFSLDHSPVLPSDYQNQTTYKRLTFYAKGNYNYVLGDVNIKAILGVYQLVNQLDLQDLYRENHPFYINPKARITWTISEKSKSFLSYNLNHSMSDVTQVFNRYILTDFNSLEKGTGGFNQLIQSSWLFNYSYGNWLDRFFANLTVLYDKDHDFLSSQRVVQQDYNLDQLILIKNRSNFNANTDFNYFFKALSINLKLTLGYYQNRFKNDINNSGLRTIKTEGYRYGLRLRSAFSGWFNFHLGTTWDRSRMILPYGYTAMNNRSFLYLNFRFSARWNAKLKADMYYYEHLKPKNTYAFVDFNAKYELIKDKLKLTLIGKNLLNIDNFKTYNFSDIMISTTQYRLLPRMLMLRAEYRF